MAVATLAIGPISMPPSCQHPRKMKSRRFTRNLRLPGYGCVGRLFVEYDAIDYAGLASAVIIHVHARARPNPCGFDLRARPVQETNGLAQGIADGTIRTRPTDDDGLARLESRDGSIGRCRRRCRFASARYRIRFRT